MYDELQKKNNLLREKYDADVKALYEEIDSLKQSMENGTAENRRLTVRSFLHHL